MMWYGQTTFSCEHVDGVDLRESTDCRVRDFLVRRETLSLGPRKVKDSSSMKQQGVLRF